MSTNWGPWSERLKPVISICDMMLRHPPPRALLCFRRSDILVREESPRLSWERPYLREWFSRGSVVPKRSVGGYLGSQRRRRAFKTRIPLHVQVLVDKDLRISTSSPCGASHIRSVARPNLKWISPWQHVVGARHQGKHLAWAPYRPERGL